MPTTQATTFNNADQTSLTAAAIAALYAQTDASGVNASGRFALVGSFQSLYVSYGARLREALVRRSVSSSIIPQLTDRDIDGTWGSKTAKAAMAVMQNAALTASQCPSGYLTIGQASLFDTAAKADANVENFLVPAWRCLTNTSIVVAGCLDFALGRVGVVRNAATQNEAVQALSTYMRTAPAAPQPASVPTAPVAVSQVTVAASNPNAGFFAAMQAAAVIPNTAPLVVPGNATTPTNLNAPVVLGEEQQITASSGRSSGLPAPVIAGTVILGAFAGVWLFKRWTQRKRR